MAERKRYYVKKRDEGLYLHINPINSRTHWDHPRNATAFKTIREARPHAVGCVIVSRRFVSKRQKEIDRAVLTQEEKSVAFSAASICEIEDERILAAVEDDVEALYPSYHSG